MLLILLTNSSIILASSTVLYHSTVVQLVQYSTTCSTVTTAATARKRDLQSALYLSSHRPLLYLTFRSVGKQIFLLMFIETLLRIIFRRHLDYVLFSLRGPCERLVIYLISNTPVHNKNISLITRCRFATELLHVITIRAISGLLKLS